MDTLLKEKQVKKMEGKVILKLADDICTEGKTLLVQDCKNSTANKLVSHY